MFKLFLADGRKKLTETETIFIVFMIAICLLCYKIYEIEKEQDKHMGHISNLATAMWESAQREIMREKRDSDRLKIPHIWNGPVLKQGVQY